MTNAPQIGRALAHLGELIGSRASGELICASSAMEVHVHLQEGRIAWATDSKHAFAFTRYLQEHAAVSKEQFREVLDECRRSHLPLGETLIEWGLATCEQVRAALHHQIASALNELSSLGHGQRVFLERSRGYAHYATALTFDASEFAIELTALSGTASGAWRVGQGLVREIRAAVNDVSWIEVMEGERVIDQDPPVREARVPLSVLGQTLLDGAAMVTLRSSRGTLVGASIGENRTIWCRVGMDSTFGTVVSTLSAIGGFEVPGPVTPRQRPSSKLRWRVGEQAPAVLSELEELIVRAPDLAALMVVSPLAAEPVHGIGSAQIAPEFCRDIVRRRSVVFGLARNIFSEMPSPPTPDLQGLGFRFQSLATAESDYWCFGAELSTPPTSSAWIFLKRTSNQGLGWACLSALSRRLEALPDWSAET